jgi:hypothetical protein
MAALAVAAAAVACRRLGKALPTAFLGELRRKASRTH